jgi:hypothetical protein
MRALATTLIGMRSAVAELSARAAASSALLDLELCALASRGPQQPPDSSPDSWHANAPSGQRWLQACGGRPERSAQQRGAPPLPPHAWGRPGGSRRRFAAAAAQAAAASRDELIDLRLAALGEEHASLQRQLHGGRGGALVGPRGNGAMPF